MQVVRKKAICNFIFFDSLGSTKHDGVKSFSLIDGQVSSQYLHLFKPEDTRLKSALASKKSQVFH